MTKKYIELEAAIRALQPTHAPAINEVLASVLRRVPAADVVEVVRCKDCCYAPTGTDNGEELINTKPCPCKGYSTALEHVTDRHADCTLFPVPPHGRLIEEADAIETAWMILRGIGYLKEENPQLEQTVREVFATAPAI